MNTNKIVEAEAKDECIQNEATTIEKWYDKNNIKWFDEFYEIAFDANKWPLCEKFGDITVESKPTGKHKVPIFRATTTIKTDDNLATPERLYSFLEKDWKMFYYFSRESQSTLIHSINRVKRIVQTVVALNSSVAYNRDYLYYETFGLCDENGKMYTLHNSQNLHKPTNKQRTLVAVLKSVNKDNKKYYTKPTDSNVRGTFYRTGYALQYISKTESKIIITLEYDVRGSKMVRYFGNGSSKNSEIALKMCQRFKKKLEFAVSYSFSLHKKCNELEIENIELKKCLVEFKIKDWKSLKICELIIWICYCLENGKFKTYESILAKTLVAQEFKVCELDKVNENDLYTFGVTKFNDRKCLMQHIQSLTDSKRITQMHENKNVVMDEANTKTENDFDDNKEEEEQVYEHQNELPPNWTVCYNEDNQAYYHNKETKESQWDPPSGDT